MNEEFNNAKEVCPYCGAKNFIKEKEEEKKKRKPTCLDMANGFGHDQAKKMGIPLSDNIPFDSWLERQKKDE